jgi:glycolate oxidase FAD binding subunit
LTVTQISPTRIEDLAEIISTGGPFAIEGRGTKQGLGRSVEAQAHISLAKFTGVDIYEPEELILDAGAATPLADMQKLLTVKHQMLAFEPPDFSHLWGTTNSGSLGGVLATALAGPRRLKAGGARDHVLGLSGVTGRGEIFKAGARVVKNVTGYDMPKLMAGSFGTLAAMTSVIFKVLPAPETEETVLIANLDDATAISVMSDAMQSSAEISGAAHVPGLGTVLRFEGIPVSVTARRDRFIAGLTHKAEVLNAKDSQSYWVKIRDCRALTHDASRALWRISVAPMAAAHIMQAISSQIDTTHFYDWAGGLIWISTPSRGDGGASIIRAAITEGHATLFAAPTDLRQRIDVFQPQAPTLAALTQRIKTALDPQAKLNPGRMYKGV